MAPPSHVATVPSEPTTEKTTCPVAGPGKAVTVAVKATGSPVTSPVGTELDSVTVAGPFTFSTALPALPVLVGVGFDEGVTVVSVAPLPLWTVFDRESKLGE